MNKLLLSALLFFCASGQAAAEVTSKFKVDIYGFIKTDLIYSDHGTGTNEYRTYATTRADKAFRASARGTRFGMNISSGSGMNGKIEMDFLGLTESLGGTAGTTADVRLRHAYVAFKTGKTEILAGQTFYPITADIPETYNDYFLGHSGALWSRAPQLRATYVPVKKLKIIAAVVRPSAKLTDAEGTRSALPGVQGKIEKEFGKARFSVAGAAGVWKSTFSAQTADSSVLVAGFNVPLSPFTVYGEAWAGRNLSDFLGGLGNTGYGANAVPGKGGYLALKFKPKDTLWFNLIYGVDDPRNSKVLTKGKTRNSTAIANASALFYDCVETGVEISSLNTEYKGSSDKSAMTYQFTVKLLF